MGKATTATLICVLLLGWLSGAQAQVTLTSPVNGADLSSEPSFAWSGPSYDAFMFISVFYYDLGYWSGYYPAKFWLLDPGFAMPSSWWDKIAEDTACYWVVLGYNTVTQKYEVSSPFSFTKTSSECAGQCTGGYTFDCNPTGLPCVCFTTTEGSGVCIDDFYCDNEPCSTSEDCGSGRVCVTCSACGVNMCADKVCTDGGPHMPRQDGAIKASGR